MNLKRPPPQGALISLVPMNDVMLILLVFFMVTSTYLNLDMIPAVRPSNEGTSQASAAPEGTIMIRIGADGQTVVQAPHSTPFHWVSGYHRPWPRNR